MRRILLSFLFLYTIAMLQAQNKMDLQLIRMLNSPRQQNAVLRGEEADAEPLVTVLAILRKGETLPSDELALMGVRCLNQLGRVATLQVPLFKLESLSELSAIESLNANGRHQILCRNSREEVRSALLQSPQLSQSLGFPQSYTGRGVLLGVVDTGIEYNHLNFRDSQTGETRLKGAALYRPMSGAADSICEFYTQKVQFDTLTTDYPQMAHGTHTAGIAAGSYLELQQQGMAPECDLMLCGMSVLEDDRLIDAMQKTFARAEELGEPCVINLSIGNPVGWKDGLSPFSLACEALTDGGNAPGRAIVMSAGNDGEKSYSATLQFSDTLPHYTLLQPIIKQNKATYYNPNIDVYCADSLPVQLCYQLFDTLHHTFSELPFEQHLLDTLEAGHDNRRHLCLDADTCSMVAWPHCLIALQIKGQIGSSATLYYINDETVAYAMSPGRDESVRWFNGTPDQSISDLCSSQSVISVGAYSAVSSLTNVFGRTIYPSEKRDNICRFSSYGTMPDGTPKPDVIAPGTCVVSSYSGYYRDKIEYYYLSQRYLDSPMMYVVDSPFDDCSYYWTADQGTSMSAPIVAGVIALWMQACPTLSVLQIRDILHHTSRWDNACVQAPHGPIQAGYGKIDAVAGMQEVLSMLGIEQIRKSVNPSDFWYNLQGQTINRPSVAGLYVVNGQLVHITQQ